MIDPAWQKAVLALRETAGELVAPPLPPVAPPLPPVAPPLPPVAPPLPPVAGLSGDQISLHRTGLPPRGARGWMVWCERGPLLCVRTRDCDRWELVPHLLYVISLPTEDAGLGDQLREWWRGTGLRGVAFKTRREALQTLRAALARDAG